MPAVVQSVERVLRILETFDGDHPSRTAGEIARLTGLTRPTTYRFLQTLQELGYVRSSGGRFELTLRIVSLASAHLGPQSLVGVAHPVLVELSERLTEHVVLGVLDGDDIVTVDSCVPSHPRFVAIAVQVGQRLPAPATALGRVLLAHRSDDPDSSEIRTNGYSVSDGLLEAGLNGIAVPVRDASGTVTAAISIGVNAGRVPIDELRTRCLPAMLEASAAITARL